MVLSKGHVLHQTGSEKNLNIVCEESERIQHIYLSIMESDLIGLVEMFSSIDVDVIHSVLESYGT